MASCRDTLSMRAPFFASFSQIPLDERGCLESHCSQSEADANARAGRPALVSVRDIGCTEFAGTRKDCRSKQDRTYLVTQTGKLARIVAQKIMPPHRVSLFAAVLRHR